jgi:serine/threonine protein phosphatase PrpC
MRSTQEPFKFQTSHHSESGWNAAVAAGQNLSKCYRNPKPLEDSFTVFDVGQMTVAVICDGVTRIDSHDKELEKARIYPQLSPATKASLLAVKTIESTFPLLCESFNTGDAIQECFGLLNYAIAQYNLELLESGPIDPAATTALIVALEGNTLHYGTVGDSLAFIAHDDGQISEITSKPKGTHEMFFDGLSGRLRKFLYTTAGLISDNPSDFGWKANTAIQKNIRNNFRNKNGKKGSFGAITGEEEGLQFYNGGSIEISYTDDVIVASDGVLSVLDRRHLNQLRRGEVTPSELLTLQEEFDLHQSLRSDDKTIIHLYRKNRVAMPDPQLRDHSFKPVIAS